MSSNHFEKVSTLQQLTDRAHFVVSAKRDPVFGPILIGQRRPVKASFATDYWYLGAFRECLFPEWDPTSALEGHLWARVNDSNGSQAVDHHSTARPAGYIALRTPGHNGPLLIILQVVQLGHTSACRQVGHYIIRSNAISTE